MSIERWNNMIIGTGPCAAETREQVLQSAQIVQERGLSFMRASLWKPRTKPGWDGVHTQGIPWLAKAAETGITVATEVLTPRQAGKVIKGLLADGQDNKLILWIGSRNQNHFDQQGIARLARGIENLQLMIKNPPWASLEHWLGVYEHVLSQGVNENQVMFCFRGFDPSLSENPYGFRNVHNGFSQVEELKRHVQKPILLDPSHIGGKDPKKIIQVAREGKQSGLFDGYIIETHPDPGNAWTDKGQQLSFAQLDNLLNILR